MVCCAQETESKRTGGNLKMPVIMQAEKDTFMLSAKHGAVMYRCRLTSGVRCAVHFLCEYIRHHPIPFLMQSFRVGN